MRSAAPRAGLSWVDASGPGLSRSGTAWASLSWVGASLATSLVLAAALPARDAAAQRAPSALGALGQSQGSGPPADRNAPVTFTAESVEYDENAALVYVWVTQDMSLAISTPAGRWTAEGAAVATGLDLTGWPREPGSVLLYPSETSRAYEPTG